MSQPVHYDVDAAIARVASDWQRLIARGRAEGVAEAVIRPQERMVPVYLAALRATLEMANDGFSPRQACEGLASMLSSFASGHNKAWQAHFAVAYATFLDANTSNPSLSEKPQPIPAMRGGHA